MTNSVLCSMSGTILSILSLSVLYIVIGFHDPHYIQNCMFILIHPTIDTVPDKVGKIMF
jgi:hypothetical protein